MESYFIGITLPPALEAEIEAWRRRFHAPRTAPHITLIPPFQWDHSYAELAAVVQSTASRRPQFTIRGAGIGSFGKAVLFVKVEPHRNCWLFSGIWPENWSNSVRPWKQGRTIPTSPSPKGRCRSAFRHMWRNG